MEVPRNVKRDKTFEKRGRKFCRRKKMTGVIKRNQKQSGRQAVGSSTKRSLLRNRYKTAVSEGFFLPSETVSFSSENTVGKSFPRGCSVIQGYTSGETKSNVK